MNILFLIIQNHLNYQYIVLIIYKLYYGCMRPMYLLIIKNNLYQK